MSHRATSVEVAVGVENYLFSYNAIINPVGYSFGVFILLRNSGHFFIDHRSSLDLIVVIKVQTIT